MIYEKFKKNNSITDCIWYNSEYIIPTKFYKNVIIIYCVYNLKIATY